MSYYSNEEAPGTRRFQGPQDSCPPAAVASPLAAPVGSRSPAMEDAMATTDAPSLGILGNSAPRTVGPEPRWKVTPTPTTQH